ncbi:LLM class flavin-dependent oxidoreductase [Rhizorhabdus argentea]|uniref:LLM class flavin-dependent oxidoreductase n=1 Tax=Rhizorhabdus argentea TaxID=1387174 RepID=UPI0030EDB1CC
MPGKVTFGYHYDFRNPSQWHKPWEQVYAEAIDVAVWSEQVGFEFAWVPEHHLFSDGYMPSPLVALAAIAARTKTIKIGTWVALAPLYHPTRFASDCAVLDILARGRLELGLGIGYLPQEYSAMGVDFTKRGRLFDEWLEIVSRLWAGETLDYAGQHYQLDGVRMMPPAPRGRIPLYIGGFAPKAIERALTYGDGYVGTPEGADIYVEQLRASGKDVSQGKVRIGDLFAVVARDPERAMEEMAPYYYHVLKIYADLGGEGMEAMSLEEFKTSGKMQVMTPEAAIARYKAMQQRMPLEHVSMIMPPGISAERFIPYAQLFADEVLPAFT